MQGRPGSSSHRKTPFLSSVPSVITSSALGPQLGLPQPPHLCVSSSSTPSAFQWDLNLQPGPQAPLRTGRTLDSNQTGVHSYFGIPFSNKKERDINAHYSLDQVQKRYGKCRRSNMENDMLYDGDSIYVQF